MNCRKFEADIHLYSDLSLEEKKAVDAHLENCANCKALFQEVQQMQNMVRRVASAGAFPTNAAKLTSDIMQSIHLTSRPLGLQNVFISFLQNRSVKFSLSIVSSVLLLVFLFELNDSVQQEKITNQIATAKGTVVLNARAFREILSKRKTKLSLYAECRSPFKSNQYFLDCAKSKSK